MFAGVALPWPWAYPALEVMHLIGVGLLLGNLVLLELRVFGRGSALPVPVNPVWPMELGEKASPPCQPPKARSQPQVRWRSSAVRTSASTAGDKIEPSSSARADPKAP